MISSQSFSSTPSDQQLLALFQEGRHYEIVAQAQALEVSAESNPLASNIVAAALFQLGEYGRAATLLEGLEVSLSNDSAYLSLYGATCRRLGILDRAEQLLRRAYQLEPQAFAVRNNYANLLIDLGREKEARILLEAILRENPNYNDARVNLNRLEFRGQLSKKDEPASILDSANSLKLADPLMLAFAEDEVLEAHNVKSSQLTTASKKLASKLPNLNAVTVASDKLSLATTAVSEGRGDFALQLCSQALEGLGANPSIYVNASDAYIKNESFTEAEICLLHAVAIGEISITHCLNLVSLASIRGDFVLASFYLDKAAGLDPSHPQLSAFRENILKQKAGHKGKAYSFESSWQ